MRLAVALAARFEAAQAQAGLILPETERKESRIIGILNKHEAKFSGIDRYRNHGVTDTTLRMEPFRISELDEPCKNALAARVGVPI